MTSFSFNKSSHIYVYSLILFLYFINKKKIILFLQKENIIVVEEII